MPNIDMIDQMKALLRRRSSCVLATTDGTAPHCSLMAYIPSEAGDRLFLVTPRNTKKFRNLTRYPKVSLLIDSRGEQARQHTQALTLNGTCYTLDNDEDISFLRQAFIRQHPHLQEFICKGDVVYLCVAFDSFLLLNGPDKAHHEILKEKPSTGGFRQ